VHLVLEKKIGKNHTSDTMALCAFRHCTKEVTDCLQHCSSEEHNTTTQ